MRNDEEFVAKSLTKHYEQLGFSPVTYSEPPKDPPDILLNIAGEISAIEVMKVDENSLNSRTKFFKAYVDFIKSVIENNKKHIPNNTYFIITVRHSSTKIRKIRKKFILFFEKELIESGFENKEYVFSDSAVNIKFSKVLTVVQSPNFPIICNNIPVRTSRNVSDFQISSLQPDVQLLSLVNKSISIKSQKCLDLPHEIDLALLDCYAEKFSSTESELFNMYEKAFSDICYRGIFKKIYVISRNGSVKVF